MSAENKFRGIKCEVIADGGLDIEAGGCTGGELLACLSAIVESLKNDTKAPEILLRSAFETGLKKERGTQT